MTRSSARRSLWQLHPLGSWLLAGMMLLAGCSDVPPSPTYPGDLGTDDRVLLPPPGARHDASALKGSAEWRPFRKLEPSEKASSGENTEKEKEKDSAAGGENSDAIQKEIEGVLADYNGLLAEGKVAETFEFFLSEQAPAAKALSEQLPQVAAKISDLATALPDHAESLKKLAERLQPAAALKLEASNIKATGQKEAKGTLASLPPFSVLPGAPSLAEASREIRFVVGEDEVWFIDWPLLLAAAKQADQIPARLSQWDSLIADAKAGAASAADLEKRAPEIAAAMNPADHPSEGEKAKPAADDGGS